MNTIQKLFKILDIRSEKEMQEVITLIKIIIRKDRQKLLKKLSNETSYEYDDIFNKVDIDLAD
ncbi:Uncharacterised protein [Chryseobacterium taklimakanense]|uniref:Uncharacterized protein n=1 Tax=Chryseobacterium taklimakanense TaxID=536441 RepID=A0A239WEQ3_9FLAO|nr:hypothetical protein [Chryseobacterium taklimakanense]SNV32094.1 Uncharacterised protein [Chryseobacterium taklimakanense]